MRCKSDDDECTFLSRVIFRVLSSVCHDLCDYFSGQESDRSALCVCLCDDGRTKSSFSCMCIFGTAVQLDLVCIKFKSQDHRSKSKVAERICPF